MTMTERPADERAGGRKPPAGKPGFMPTVLLSVACFLALFTFLAFQFTAGKTRATALPPQSDNGIVSSAPSPAETLPAPPPVTSSS